jgi:acyl-CoA thioesterase FadM
MRERVVRLPRHDGEQEQVVAEGEAWCATLAARSGKPTRMPAQMREKLKLLQLQCMMDRPTKGGGE